MNDKKYLTLTTLMYSKNNPSLNPLSHLHDQNLILSNSHKSKYNKLQFIIITVAITLTLTIHLLTVTISTANNISIYHNNNKEEHNKNYKPNKDKKKKKKVKKYPTGSHSLTNKKSTSPNVYLKDLYY